MGATKRLLMEREELWEAAREILCAADVIKECPYHGGTYIESGGSGDLTYAYRIANARITAGEMEFDRRELTDAIKEQGEMYWPDSCPSCDKW
jgi:hypothetical protein